MSGTISNDSKYHRKFTITSSGDVIDAASKLKAQFGELLTSENHLRIVTEAFGPTNSIDIKAKLRNQAAFTVIDTVVGNTTQVVDISSWEIIHYDVTTLDGTGNLIITGFVKNTPDALSAASVDLVQVSPTETGTTAIVNIGTSEVEITASALQQGITITQIDAGRVHWSYQTGVSTSNANIRRTEQIVAENHAGSIFLIAASGTINVQVDREIN